MHSCERLFQFSSKLKPFIYFAQIEISTNKNLYSRGVNSFDGTELKQSYHVAGQLFNVTQEETGFTK